MYHLAFCTNTKFVILSFATLCKAVIRAQNIFVFLDGHHVGLVDQSARDSVRETNGTLILHAILVGEKKLSFMM